MSDDETAIRTVVSDYVTAMTRGDRTALRRVFHAKSASIGHFDGALEWLDVDGFADTCEAEALPADRPVPPMTIENLHISGDTAVVIVTNVWAGFTFRDILTLLRENGTWSIVFKCFHHTG